MSVSVVVPWRAGCPHREQAWEWVRARLEAVHPDWEIVTGDSDTDRFSASRAIHDGAQRACGDLLVFFDADVWCDPAEAVDALAEHPWSIPHYLVHRLSEESSAAFMAGAALPLPLDRSNTQDRHPYPGHAGGGIVAMRRDVYEQAPPDPRFVGWGHQDDSWALALTTLFGKPWRGTLDLVHLWHPPQERLSRKVGTTEGLALYRRYQFANRDPDRMRALIEEAA